MLKCPGCGEENPPRFKLCGYCGTPLVAARVPPAHELRKTVSVLFTDLKDSTVLGERLDSEALHEVKEHYFRAMTAEILRHGGKIEKYIGDAIMAVFGLPRAREDDALRAVRAAAGMRAALGSVNRDLMARYGVSLASRTGISTGEVIATDDADATQNLVTGDTVNVAARLEAAAPAGAIHIGEVTFQLVRDAVEVEPLGPLELKGKAERVAAYRLLAVRELEEDSPRMRTAIAGRDGEVAALEAAYREVRARRSVILVTVVGDAGIGKSRLVHEVAERVASGTRVLRGRCLPYGDGITFWPLVSIVAQAAGIRESDAPEDACAKLLAAIEDADVTRRLSSAIGLSTATFPLPEVNWAARRFFEIMASAGPLTVIIEDIHWAENAFLELLEHVRDRAAEAPILLLVTSRHDLLERCPDWGTKPRETRLVLHPLDDAASAQVLTNALGGAELPPALRARIVGEAGGNPLYVEQLLSMLIDSHALRSQDGRWVCADEATGIAVPATIRALLEARLDQLDRATRAAIEPASVIGLEFPVSAVEALVPDALRPAVGEHLATLARKQFIHPVPRADDEIVYRFQHHLVRDTVYSGMLKRARAQLHADFVRWADRVNAERERGLAFEEILGYHLEQAHRCLSELGALDDQGIAIGVDAARRLSAAGRRAFARGDMHAAANLFQRAIALLREGDARRLELLPELGEVLLDKGDFNQARTTLIAAQATAERAGNRRIAASAQLLRMRVRFYSAEPGDDWREETLRAASEAIPLFERAAAYPELTRAWRLMAFVHGIAGHYGKAGEDTARSMQYARLAGDERLVARNAMGLAITGLLGPTPVPEVIAHCEQVLAHGLSDRQAESKLLTTLAQLHAMNGDFARARTLYRRGRGLLRELGQGVNAASTGIDILFIETLAGDLAAAEREVMPDYEFLKQAGETYFLSTMAAMISRVVRDQGRDEEALAFSRVAEGASAADDVESQALWRSIRAPIVARAGNLADADTLARAAVALAQKTDAPQLRADTLAELAAVLSLAGKPGAARVAVDEAIGVYRAKGDIVSAARAERWRAGLK